MLNRYVYIYNCTLSFLLQFAVCVAAAVALVVRDEDPETTDKARFATCKQSCIDVLVECKDANVDHLREYMNCFSVSLDCYRKCKELYPGGVFFRKKQN